jgi:hypothetical protein
LGGVEDLEAAIAAGDAFFRDLKELPQTQAYLGQHFDSKGGEENFNSLLVCIKGWYDITSSS